MQLVDCAVVVIPRLNIQPTEAFDSFDKNSTTLIDRAMKLITAQIARRAYLNSEPHNCLDQWFSTFLQLPPPLSCRVEVGFHSPLPRS